MLSDEEKIAARLFIADALNLGAEVRFDTSRTHYLRNVLRLAPGNWLALVNGRDGEARARIEGLEKRGGYARIIAITRAFTPEPDLWLLFAPIKRARLDLLVEKATELGVARLLPTLTRRTNTDRLSRERLILIAREATEQCERLTLPEIEESVSLTQRLADWPADRFLIVADEAGGDGDALSALAILPPGAKLALLIGPEGGFDPIERELLKGLAIEEFPDVYKRQVRGRFTTISPPNGKSAVFGLSLIHI